jgi:hypothetical protein
MLFKGMAAVKNFRVGDLVYDPYYGAGVVIDLSDELGDMEVRFRKPEKCIFLSPITINTLEVISKAKHRKRHQLR